MSRVSPVVGLVVLWILPGALGAQAQLEAPPAARSHLSAEHAGGDAVDPVAELLTRLRSGEAVLARDPVWGFLPAVLEQLDVPVSSQSLVFSRTSLQVDVIAPWAPRAIYFNDDVYVGYTVDGLVLEIAAVDPDGGSVFYTVDQFADEGVEPRADELTCKGCHATGVTGGVPGVMMRSFLTDRMGNTLAPIDERPTDDRTPMERRFGGWYVTGTHSLPHAGNTRSDEIVHEIDDPYGYTEAFDVNAGGNALELGEWFEESFYLTRGSDIVALLVLAHQTRVHNLITLAAKAAAEAERELQWARLTAGDEVDETALTQRTLDQIDFAVQSLVRAMLFYRAEPIGQVQGTSTFASEFSALGPRDSRGRSLRDFSLDERLFEYPLSFLVYSDAWDALPPIILKRAYTLMHDILSGDDDPEFPLLDEERRRQVLEILLETKPEAADFIETSAVER